jgi:tetratricopeptide (TPR) repeat protein/predicted Ser/Thr protein kinase
MSAERYQRTRAIFESLCDLDPDAQREQLQAMCAGDDELRAAVQKLLDMDSAMQSNDSEPGLLGMSDAGEPDIPESIGNYKVHRLLGRGGTSVVYEAQQANPSRRVALKVVSTLGVRSDLERRFELEAQIMGSFTHPGIASVYETGRVNLGATEALYIAMELVQGEHLIEHVRRTKPSIETRVRLMMDVCDAIEHAHAQGVIHRDLKPGNIMVDGSGHVKVLDFGIARITNPDSLDATMHTEPGRIIGTPAYMSPEQLRGEAHTLGVRSDVYALGVVFYQMLADRLPYDFASASLVHAARTIEHATYQRLGTIDTRMRGDLETIIDKALEKDPSRRYTSAGSLRDDLRRYLDHEPIEARAPSAWYHARQFVRRHRAVSVGSILALLGLVAGIVALSIGIIRERDAREIAEDKTRAMQSMMTFVLNDMLEQADVRESTDRKLTVMEALENAADRIDERFPDDPLIAANIERMIGRSQVSLGRYDDAEPHLRRSIELFSTHLGPDNPETLLAREELGVLLNNTSRKDEARAELESLYADRLRVLGETHRDTLRSANDLALFYSRVGEHDRSKSMHKRVLEIRRDTEGDLGYGTLLSQHNLALTLLWMRQPEQAVKIYEDVVPKRIETLGPEHPATLLSMNNLAGGYRDLGRDQEALTIYRQASEAQQRTLGPGHPSTLRTLGNIGSLLLKSDPVAAEEPITLSYEGRLKVLGPDHMETLVSQRMHAQWLIETGRAADGLTELLQVYERQTELLGPDHRDSMSTKKLIDRIESTIPD